MKIHNKSLRNTTGKVPLCSEDVHIWCANLSRHSKSLWKLKGVLNDEEITKASRFVFDKDRERYIVKHGLLRKIIGEYYLINNAENIKFQRNAFGKPYLNCDGKQESLYFNATASKDYALYAFSRIYEIGIDIEFMRNIDETDEIFANNFSKSENIIFKKLEKGERQKAFFYCWTIKEAFVKAIGKGLYFPLQNFDITFKEGERAKIVGIEGDKKKGEEWTISKLFPVEGYVGAIAIKKKEIRINWIELI